MESIAMFASWRIFQWCACWVNYLCLGYHLLNHHLHCIPHADINECDRFSPCDQVCTNTDGSFVCSCNSGYQLENVTQTCEGEYFFVACVTLHPIISLSVRCRWVPHGSSGRYGDLPARKYSMCEHWGIFWMCLCGWLWTHCWRM